MHFSWWYCQNKGVQHPINGHLRQTYHKSSAKDKFEVYSHKRNAIYGGNIRQPDYCPRLHVWLFDAMENLWGKCIQAERKFSWGVCSSDKTVNRFLSLNCCSSKNAIEECKHLYTNERSI